MACPEGSTVSFSLENKWARSQVPAPCVSRNEVPPDLSRLYVTTSFHPVVGLPMAFLSLRKDSPFKSWVFPQLQGRATSACLWRQKVLGRRWEWGSLDCWVTLLPVPVNELMIQWLGQGWVCRTPCCRSMEGWAEMRLGPPP